MIFALAKRTFITSSLLCLFKMHRSSASRQEEQNKVLESVASINDGLRKSLIFEDKPVIPFGLNDEWDLILEPSSPMLTKGTSFQAPVQSYFNSSWDHANGPNLRRPGRKKGAQSMRGFSFSKKMIKSFNDPIR